MKLGTDKVKSSWKALKDKGGNPFASLWEIWMFLWEENSLM